MLVWLSVWSKVQTTLWSTYKLYDLHAIFYSRLSVSKSIFVSLGSKFFLLFFLWRPLTCGGLGQLPSLPPLKSGPVGNFRNTYNNNIWVYSPQNRPVCFVQFHWDCFDCCFRRGQDSPWKSQSEWQQRTEINGESTSMQCGQASDWGRLQNRTVFDAVKGGAHSHRPTRRDSFVASSRAVWIGHNTVPEWLNCRLLLNTAVSDTEACGGGLLLGVGALGGCLA